MQKVSGLPQAKVGGRAGVLDSARLAGFVAMELGVSAESVQAIVMGGHGDTMVGLYDFCSVGGIPLRQLMDKPTFDKLAKRTAGAGGEIVALLKTGSAFYSPGVSAVDMAESYLLDKKKVVTVADALNGQYGVEGGLYCGVPVVIGEHGVERSFEVNLNDEEKTACDASVAAVQDLVAWVAKKQ